MSNLTENTAVQEGESSMTDFQFKQIIEMVYQIVKANHEAGKSVEDILATIAALRDNAVTPPETP